MNCGEYIIVKIVVFVVVCLFVVCFCNEQIGVYEVCFGFIKIDMIILVMVYYDELIVKGLVLWGCWGYLVDIVFIVCVMVEGKLIYICG